MFFSSISANLANVDLTMLTQLSDNYSADFVIQPAEVGNLLAKSTFIKPQNLIIYPLATT